MSAKNMSLPDAIRLALGHHTAGRLAQAERLYRQVLDVEPDNIDALHLLGVMAYQAGDREAAITLYQRALAISPDAAAVASNLGNALRALGDLDGAVAAQRRAVGADPTFAEAWSNLGIALHEQHKLEEGATAYERAIALDPGYAMAHFNLGNLRKDQGRLKAAIDSWQRVLEIDPEGADAYNNIGNAFHKLGQLERAAHACERAVALAPKFVGAHFNLGNVLKDRGAFPEAIACFDRALEVDPRYAPALAAKAAVLLAAGDPTGAAVVCEACRRIEPYRQQAIAYGAIANQELGNSAAAAAVNDYDQLICTAWLEAPEGYADIAAFNRDLVAAVRAHPTLTLEPGNYLTRGGRLTANLLVGPSPLIRLFERTVRRAIDRHLKALRADPAHPFLGRIPQRYDMRLRATILNAGGWHPEHLHEHEWLSGVYYPEVPAGDGEQNLGGCIEFGRPDYPLPGGSKVKFRTIRPEPGMLLLFPSYIFHRTIPFRGAGERFSLAFDLSPA